MTETATHDPDRLWNGITRYSKRVGRIATRPLLLLYYVMKSPDTPKRDKVIISAAIAYVVLPINIISVKRFPIIGWVDEVLSIAVAYDRMKRHITPEMERKADEQLDKWFEKA